MMHWKADKASKLGAHHVPLQKSEGENGVWFSRLFFFFFFIPPP
jgi:hypothetical protein